MAQFPLIDQASLVMIPGAYKESKVYSQLPTDGSGDFTFSRGTDNATRVNEEGLIEKGYENTLLGSNDWARDDSSYTITGGEAGYDGTNDAWLVNKLAAAYFSKDALVLTGVHTISFYAKAGSLDRIFVFIGGEAARFDLTNGTAVSAGGNPVSQNIELVSGTTDWYRCSIVINKNTTQNFLIKPQNSSNQDVTGTIYIQDAQLNQGLVAYPYLKTTAVPAYGGITDNQPRLNYTGDCPSLLLEPSRTNLVPSILFNALNGASYTISETNIGSEGGMPMQHFTKTAVGQYAAHILNGQSVLAGDTYAFSIFFKPISSNSGFNRIAMHFSGQTDFIIYDYARDGFFQDTSGTALPSNKYVEEYANGVYRIISIQTAVANGNRIDINIDSYYNTSSQFLCGYAQIEEATYPTSYIPTYGSTQTRAAETLTATKTLPSEGTLYINVGGTTQPKLSVLREYFDASATENKVAIAYSATALKISHNGSIVVDKTGTYDVSSLTEIDLGHDGGTDQADTSIGEFITFGSFLTTTELNALTQ